MKPPYNEHQQLSSQQERREAKPATRPASGEPCPAPGTWLARLRCPPAPTERKPVLSLFRLQNRRPTLRPSSSVQQKLSLRFHQKGVRSLRVDILYFVAQSTITEQTGGNGSMRKQRGDLRTLARLSRPKAGGAGVEGDRPHVVAEHSTATQVSPLEALSPRVCC